MLVVSSAGKIVGATLGNDVNLRDVEGRSALLLGKAKDNNASAAIGPFIRLFDADFALDDVRRAELRLTVEGDDGFRLEGASDMGKISRDPEEIVPPDDRREPSIPGRLRALSRHDVRADQGSWRAGPGLHPQDRRRGERAVAAARAARQRR